MSSVDVRFYRLTFSEALQQGKLIAFYWIVKKVLRLGTYGHVAVIVNDETNAVEYTLTDEGLVSYHPSETELVSSDTVCTTAGAFTTLQLIQKWEEVAGHTPVTVRSLAEALARPNCYSNRGCCTLFVSYVLTLPPTTLADELCQIILLDTSHVRNVVPRTTSESGVLRRVEKNATASVVKRQWALGLIRKSLGLYDTMATMRFTGEKFLGKLASSMTWLLRVKP